MNERIAQPRRRAGWVTGKRARDGKPISVNLAMVCAIEPSRPVKRGEVSIETLCFSYPGATQEEQTGDVLERTEDVLRQLADEGLGG